jgi:hypothetical protein
MNRLLSRWSANALVIGLFLVPSFGCVMYGDEYGGLPYGVDYYQPYYGTYAQPYYGTYAGNYGGWGPGYGVAPYRGGVYHSVVSTGRPSPPAYRPAAATHPVPSIPSRSRSGDSRQTSRQPR